MPHRRSYISWGIALTALLGLGAFLNPQSEDRAIATIIRSGGRVYYGFQSPRLSTRSATPPTTVSPSESATLAIHSWQAQAPHQSDPTDWITSDTKVGFSTIPTTQPPKSLFGLNVSGTVLPVQQSTVPNYEEQELYFEVPPHSDSDHIAERILVDISRRIECATVGPRLDTDVIHALTQLRQLRQLIVHGSNREKRQELARKLPAVEIIYR